METFSEFKAQFYSRIQDPFVFNCQDFNILKVVLDGLKVNYAGRGVYKARMFSNLLEYKLYLFIKRQQQGRKSAVQKLLKFTGRKYLLIDPGRYKNDENQKPVSSYFYNLYNVITDYTSLSEREVQSQLFDFTAASLSAELQYEELNTDEKLLRTELIKTFFRIKNLEVFSEYELLNIKIAIDEFFKKYREWDRILKILKPGKVFCVSHYHKEGALLAMKRNKIKCIELQHGLIAPEDIFYMFPEKVKSIRDKALFADEIWVYGEFWKQRLLKGAEYAEQQIRVFGYYLQENKTIPVAVTERLNSLKGENKVILITTQDKHPEEIKGYIRFLSDDLIKKKYSYVIWVKPHPAEKKGAFAEVARLSNVVVLEENLDYLFRFSNLMLSIYSTTLYDACRYGIPAFSLYTKSCADYVDSIVQSGVASLIREDQNPVEMLSLSQGKINSEFYFANCNYSMLLS